MSDTTNWGLKIISTHIANAEYVIRAVPELIAEIKRLRNCLEQKGPSIPAERIKELISAWTNEIDRLRAGGFGAKADGVEWITDQLSEITVERSVND